MLKKAEEWADKNNIKFPRIDTKPFEGKPIEEVYVFGDDKDINCPTILHFVLVNKGFWEFEKPGILLKHMQQLCYWPLPYPSI